MPTKPTEVTGESPGLRQTKITWNVSNVHVESGFAIERDVGSEQTPDWEMVGEYGPVPLGKELIYATVAKQQPGTASYRVVSLTNAPLQPGPAASGPIAIYVQGPTASLAIRGDLVAGDGTVNKAEKAAGFAINGRTEPGASVTVTVNGTQLPSSATGDVDGLWEALVPAHASYVTTGTVMVSATASKSGFVEGTADVTITVDLVAPTVIYKSATALTVGVTITPIVPTTSDRDIVSYALKEGSTLPAGLRLTGPPGMNLQAGTISGRPSAVTPARTVTIIVTDQADNTSETLLVIGVVATPPPDPKPTVTITLETPSAGSLREGETATFLLTRTSENRASSLRVFVGITETGNVIRPPSPPRSVTIPAGMLTHTFQVATNDDSTDESDSVVTATVQDRSAYDPGSQDSATVTVKDNDVTVRVALRVRASANIEVALQQHDANGQRGERKLPSARTVPSTATIDTWYASSSVTVTDPETGHSVAVRIRGRRLANDRAEVAVQQAGEDGVWDPPKLPTARILNTDTATIDAWHITTAVTVAANPRDDYEPEEDDAGGNSPRSMEPDPSEANGQPGNSGGALVEPDS